jgi:hypothetical protein
MAACLPGFTGYGPSGDAPASASYPLYGMPASSPPPTAPLVVSAMRSSPVRPTPITQIQFPPSPSPIPGASAPLAYPVFTQPFHQAPPQHPGFLEDHTAGAGVPQYFKLSFPTFDGHEDPLGSLNRCDHFFRAQHTGQAEKVGLASFHMTGHAQQWYYMLERDVGIVTWQHFKALCQQCFGPALGTNHLDDLARLPFRSTVEDYLQTFQDRLAHAGYLTPEQQVQLFTGGLPEAIRVDVELQAPPDLQRVMVLARAYERHVAAAPPPQGARPARSSARLLPLPAPPVGAPPPPAAATGPQPPAASRPFRRLSPAEMADRRRQGLCYNCDEPYVRGHKCQRLFYLEVTDHIDDQ